MSGVNFIVHNNVGTILRTGRCGKEDLLLQAQGPLESVIEGKADDIKNKIDVETNEILPNPEGIALEKARLKEREDRRKVKKDKTDKLSKKLKKILNRTSSDTLLEKVETLAEALLAKGF